MSALPVAGAAGPAQFELWCFNLRTEFKDKDDGPNGWGFRREAVADLIRARQPAVVCVQEATPGMLDFLVSHMGEGNYSWVGTSRSLKTGDEMAGFLYNRRCMDLVVHHTLWLAADGTPRGTPGWDAMYPRTLETAVFRLLAPNADGPPQQAGLVRLLNTHFDHVGVQARKKSAELIAKAIDDGALEWPQCVQIVTGDFNNIKINNEVYDILARPQTGLLDTARQVVLPQDTVPFTLHKFQGLDFDPVRGDGTVELSAGPTAKLDAQHIDWVLFRNGDDLQLQAASYEVMTDRVAGGGPYVSDHFPVGVTFNITRRTASTDAVQHGSQTGDTSDGPIAHQRSRL
jgi:endonuclease/exonuclease/phosphatase family metal-dependent hydrolase